MIAYIPARSGSKRIPDKNVKLLNDKPIINYVINTLSNLEFISDVYVSTDSEVIKEVAKKAGAKVLELRDESLSDDKAGFMDLIKYDIPRHINDNGESSDVLFVLATAALVPVGTYLDAYNVWKKSNADILMSCKTYNKSPYWALVPDKEGYLKPLFEKMVYVNSQDLPDSYTDAGLFYYFNSNNIIKYDNHKVVDKLMPYIVDEDWAIDIDTIKDWKRLESVLNKKYE